MQAISRATDNKPVVYRNVQVTINVPYRKPGNVIEHLPVDFSVHQYGNKVKAIPLCNAALLRLIALPVVIQFSIENNKPVLQRKNFSEVAEDIFHHLRVQTGTYVTSS